MEDKEGQESETREATSGIGILDVGDLSELLRVSVQTARRYINEGRIPAYRVVPGKYLISVNVLRSTLKDNQINNLYLGRSGLKLKYHFRTHMESIANFIQVKRFDKYFLRSRGNYLIF